MTTIPRCQPLTFQYPQSDRGHCNLVSRKCCKWVGLHLSVSSVGSWALQLRKPRLVHQFHHLFQYPQSDRGHCNKVLRVLQFFSSRNFQYPQSDRGHCNSFMPGLRNASASLSVSSVGSWALQPRLCSMTSVPAATFSILSRIVGTATRERHRPMPPGLPLSVSSVGSWALQRSRGTDSDQCNHHLSVSSVGSWALQLSQ